MSDSSYDLKPSKEAYKAIKSDVTPVSAIKELIDNALDNWQRTSQKLDDLTISIDYEENDNGNQIRITDNSGGVPEDDVSMLFALGQSAKEDITGSIGAYGIGAKKAIVNLGDQATIKSRALHTEHGFGFTIDQDWLEDEDDWTVDKHEYDDIDEGVTEIIISDLNADWDDFGEDLKKDLAATYRLFLSEDRLTDIADLTIEVNSDELTPPDKTNWSYTPIDGFHPRRYEDIKIESRDLSDPVYLDVQVGLLEKADDSVAGAEIYCQNRQILQRVRDERAGFNTGSGSSRLGKFTGQHRRLKVEIEFYTEGDASELPWDAQKSDIDRYHKVTQAALDWVRRIVNPYREAAGEYDEFPTTFTRPYNKDHEYAHETKVYDYSDRERVTHKPDTDFPEAAQIQSQVEATYPLQLRNTGDLPAEFVPAYEEELTRKLNIDVDFDVEIDQIPEVDDIPELDDIEMRAVERGLAQQAERDVEAGRFVTGMEPWQQAIYRWQVQIVLHEINEEAEDDEEVPEGIDDLEERTREELEEEEDDGEGERQEFGVDLDEVSRGGGPEDGDEESATDADEGDTGVDRMSEGEGDEAESDVTEYEQDVADDDSGQQRLTGTEDQVTAEGDEQVVTADNTLYIPIPEDRREELFEALGIEEDANEDEIAEELLEKISVLRQLRA